MSKAADVERRVERILESIHEETQTEGREHRRARRRAIRRKKLVFYCLLSFALGWIFGRLFAG